MIKNRIKETENKQQKQLDMKMRKQDMEAKRAKKRHGEKHHERRRQWKKETKEKLQEDKGKGIKYKEERIGGKTKVGWKDERNERISR